MTGSSSLSFFVRNFWNNWPIIVAAVVITFMTLGLSWWFLSETEFSHIPRPGMN